MIDPDDPVVDLVDSDDGTFTVKQASGAEVPGVPAEFRERFQSVMAPAPMAPEAPPPMIAAPEPAPAPVAQSAPVAQPTAPAAALAPVVAPQMVQTASTSSRQSNTNVSGIDSASRQRIEQAGAEQDRAAMDAQEATTARIEAEAMEANAKTQLAIEHTDAELQKKREAQAAGQTVYDEEMQKYDAAVNRPIDASQVFEGKNLGLAFGVAIAQAFSNAFAVKAGQRPTLDLITGVINRSIDEQRRKRQLALGDSKEAKLQVAQEMKQREAEMSELAARRLELIGSMGSDTVRQAQAKEAAMAQRAVQRERKSKEAQMLASKVSRSVTESQNTQSARVAPQVVEQSRYRDEAAEAENRDRELRILAKKNGTSYEKEVARYDKAIDKYRPIAIEVAHADALDNLLKSATDEGTNDVAGYGRLAKMLPGEFVGEEGKRLRARIGNEMAQYMNKISGAAVSEEERKRMNGIILGAGSFKDMQNGLQMLAESARATAKSYRNGPDGIFARIYDSSQSRGAAREAAKGGFEAQKQAMANAKREPTTEAGKAKAESDAKLSRQREILAQRKAAKNKPKVNAAAVLRTLGAPKPGESDRVKRLREQAQRTLQVAEQGELQEALKGSRPSGRMY